MNKWTQNDPIGLKRALNILPECKRLIRHGHGQESLDKIAGAIAVGFISAEHVTRELGFNAKELADAVKLYRQGYMNDLRDA